MNYSEKPMGFLKPIVNIDVKVNDTFNFYCPECKMTHSRKINQVVPFFNELYEREDCLASLVEICPHCNKLYTQDILFCVNSQYDYFFSEAGAFSQKDINIADIGNTIMSEDHIRYMLNELVSDGYWIGGGIHTLQKAGYTVEKVEIKVAKDIDYIKFLINNEFSMEEMYHAELGEHKLIFQGQVLTENSDWDEK